jgi:acid phosphatase family membrane protein YuiD
MNVIIVSVCACVISQLLKVLIILVQKKQLDFRAFITTGGMPSAHSAIVSALATSVAMVEGLESVVFGVSAVLAFVVMIDAAGLRRSVGKQAIVLNRIVKELKERRTKADSEHDLRELIGHTTPQVIVGACLGVAVSYLWFTLLA